jgi:hypothetical protein
MRRLRPEALNLVAVAAAVTVVCAFLPWASVLGEQTRGIETHGRITLAAGLAGLALLAVRRVVAVALAELALGALVAAVALEARTSYAAAGVQLTMLAGLVWAGAAAWAIRTRHTG